MIYFIVVILNDLDINIQNPWLASALITHGAISQLFSPWAILPRDTVVMGFKPKFKENLSAGKHSKWLAMKSYLQKKILKKNIIRL